MKSASAGLIALLNSGLKFYMADLLTITSVTGSVFRYADADIDVTLGGNLFSSKQILFSVGSIRTVIGVEVDELSLNVWANASDTLSGVPFFQALHNGALDGAVVKVERVFMAPPDPSVGLIRWDTSLGSLIRFLGRVSDFEVGATQAAITVKSEFEILNVQLPRNLYQPGCIHTLYDTGCTLSKAAFGANSSAAAGSTRLVIQSTLAQAAGYFDLGIVTFTSGPNTGVSRTVKSFAGGVLTLVYPFASTPAVGNTFTAYPGCDKLQATCLNKFANLANFRGFPYVPVPETGV
jgi:uncharacterized phage protein (TIGR02218 family)